jgi:hypothetical protein
MLAAATKRWAATNILLMTAHDSSLVSNKSSARFYARLRLNFSLRR